MTRQLEVGKQNFNHNQKKESNKEKEKCTLNFCFINVEQIKS